jgi:hypothetical protein
MSTRFTGSYTSARGLTYEYEGNWQRFGHRISWTVKVRHGADVVAINDEMPVGDGSFDVEAAVRLLVERRIEKEHEP